MRRLNIPRAGLYNGNIRHSVLAMDSLNYPNLGYIYQYDQLNRLKHQRAYEGLDTTNNQWTTAAVLDDYKENIDYDPNGNILTYERFATRNRGPHLHMDSLTYKYTSSTNQLDHVNDQIAATNYPTEDIDDQSSGNYTYDHIGNLTYDVSEGEQYGWWNNGKLAEVLRLISGGTTNFDIQYGYDPMGNRIEKLTQNDTAATYLIYVRDAQGNIMATYSYDIIYGIYTLKELNMYGSSRLGVVNADTVLFDYTTHTPTTIQSPWVGKKMYELTNHLGNVLATVTDKKVLFDNNNDNLADWSVPEISSASDYYPGGMLQPGRSYSSSDYRFGFNGKEKDDEIKGIGNSIDFGNRMYDARLVRWNSPDKLAHLYSGISPYASVLNNPLVHVDVKGDSVELIIGKPYTDANGEEHPYGHAALRVFNAAEGYDMVYDFGRYGATHGLFSSEGEGILNVYSSSKSYLADEQKFRSSTGYMQPTTADQDKQVMSFFQQKIDGGEKYKTGAVPGGGGTAFKLQEDYHYNNNNCMTLSCAGLNVIGLNWLGDENRPNDASETMESSYKDSRLTRTSYPKGGGSSLTWKPGAFKPLDVSKFKIDPSAYVMPQDNLKSPVKPAPEAAPQR